MRKLIIILAVLTFSCVNKKSRFVDVSNINEIIKIKMSKKELIEKIGIPKDSVLSEKDKEHNIYDYQYDTNDFSGYTLKVWFNKDQEVINFRVD